ncbi:unnamed protein product [Chrysodeixis includens]|uniref:Uncharacterized protein n=1 Tax=Chrysodeixis includens TaxID=689277 RepID=A0A9N8PXK5_CHRIL|nr:unnamed protein product [Chrysodeixis includens]
MAERTTMGWPFSNLSPSFTLIVSIVPSNGAPTWLSSPFRAFGWTFNSLVAFSSLTNKDRSCPFSSKNTSLSPVVVSSSDTAIVLMSNVFPRSIFTSIVSPIFGPTRKVLVSKCLMGPNLSRMRKNSFATCGYIAADITSCSDTSG